MSLRLRLATALIILAGAVLALAIGLYCLATGSDDPLDDLADANGLGTSFHGGVSTHG
jgi:hypothetical protein